MLATMKNPEESMPASPSILQGPEAYIEHKFLHRVFEEEMVKNAVFEKPALIFEDDNVRRRVTKYVDLNHNANQMANTLLDTIKESGSVANQDGDWVIAVCMKPSDNLVTTLLAIWKAGAAYLPINVAFPEKDVEHILKEAKPALVIYDKTYQNSKYFSSVKSIKREDLERDSRQMSAGNIPDELTLSKGDAGMKAIVIYTSGSTGLSKGVRIRHHTFMHRIQWQLETHPYTASETHCVFKTTLSFLDHVAELWCPLFAGKTVIVVPKDVVKNPERFVSILEEFRIRRLLGVPTLLRGILMYLNMQESNKTKYLLSKLRIWVSSGETLTLQLAKEFFDYFENGKQTLLNFYGCTEITGDVCYYEIQSKQQLSTLESIPLGVPIPNTILYVLDQDKKIVNAGEVGEIYCAGLMVTDGYIAGREPDAFRNSHLESSPPFHRMYRTGDYGQMKDGLLYFEGRRDTQIKVRGHRIDIVEVEKNVNELSYVDQSAILVYHAGQIEQALVAFIETKKVNYKPIQKTPMDVEKELRSRLAEYMMPKVEIVTEFPYTITGKVDRQQLLEMYEENAVKSKAAGIQIRMDLKNVPKEKLNVARQVFEIIGNSLGNDLRNKVSLKSNFFDLGGNSMNSISTVNELRSRGFFIGITDFLTAADLGTVLNKVSYKKPKSNDNKIITGMNLSVEALNELEKEASMRLLARSFFTKSTMDRCLPGLKMEHYLEILRVFWDEATKEGYSFMVKNEKGRLVGVTLNFDVQDEPDVETDNPLGTIFEFLNQLEKPVLESKTSCKMLHTFMMGTAEKLNARDNIGIMAFMEAEVIKLASSKGFEGIVATNTNPLTIHFGESVFGYETMNEIRVNQYTDREGNRPFVSASNSEKAVVMFKNLKRNE